MNKLETLAKKIFDECQKDGEPVTMEEALEMAEMEMGAKEIKSYAQSEETAEKKKAQGEKKKVTKKVSDEKKALFSQIYQNLREIYSENAEIGTENKLIYVKIGGKTYKIDVIEQRNKK